MTFLGEPPIAAGWKNSMLGLVGVGGVRYRVVVHVDQLRCSESCKCGAGVFCLPEAPARTASARPYPRRMRVLARRKLDAQPEEPFQPAPPADAGRTASITCLGMSKSNIGSGAESPGAVAEHDVLDIAAPRPGTYPRGERGVELLDSGGLAWSLAAAAARVLPSIRSERGHVEFWSAGFRPGRSPASCRPPGRRRTSRLKPALIASRRSSFPIAPAVVHPHPLLRHPPHLRLDDARHALGELDRIVVALDTKNGSPMISRCRPSGSRSMRMSTAIDSVRTASSPDRSASSAGRPKNGTFTCPCGGLVDEERRMPAP